MWNTSNASMWDEARRSHKASEDVPVPFAAILSNLIRQGRLQERVSEFGKWILAHSLYRYVCVNYTRSYLTGASPDYAIRRTCRIHCWDILSRFIHRSRTPFLVRDKGGRCVDSLSCAAHIALEIRSFCLASSSTHGRATCPLPNLRRFLRPPTF
jgi:hypothetical protein